MKLGHMESAYHFAHWVYRSRRKLATLTILALALPLALHVVFDANGMVVYQKKRAESRKLEVEVDTLQKENSVLAEQIRLLKSGESKAIEKEAREQLHYTRPGEVVYTLPAASAVVPSNDTAAAQKP